MLYSKRILKIATIFLLLFTGVLFVSYLFANTTNASDQPVKTTTQCEAAFREIPAQVYTGAQIEIKMDFKNTGTDTITDANASIILPQGATLKNYDWNTKTQRVNGLGKMLAGKTLSDIPPELYAFSADSFNNTPETIKDFVKPFEELGLRMSANVMAGALYYDAWDPDYTYLNGLSFPEYIKAKGHEITSETYHHSYLGSCAAIDSTITGEPYRRYKRGSTWGFANTEEEEKIEVLLGKYWNEIFFDTRMEGFKSPFMGTNLAEGGHPDPLRSGLWNVIGKSGFRYTASTFETAPFIPPAQTSNDRQIIIHGVQPAWPPLCDEETGPKSDDPYKNITHNIHNILAGSERFDNQYYVNITDKALTGFPYPIAIDGLKSYIDRHYAQPQKDIPHQYFDGRPGPLLTQQNAPTLFRLNPSDSNSFIPESWKTSGKKGFDWIYDIHDYISQTYPDAQNATQKDIIDYYLGTGSVTWNITMPEAPGTYEFTVIGPDNNPHSIQVDVKTPESLYNEVASKVLRVNNASEVAHASSANYTDVLFTVKGQTGLPYLAELDAVISAASAYALGVYTEIQVFKDTDMHVTSTKDFNNNIVSHVAEPTDIAYRKALKELIATLGTKNIKGIILDASFPSNEKNLPTYGYSDDMIHHFEKYFGPPPTGANPQDPTSENDPVYWSIYTPAHTSDWRSNDIEWLYYNIRLLARTLITTDDISNLGDDENGIRVVDWLLCKYSDGSDNTGVSSWDEWEAWGEFRRCMIADFVNEIAGGTTKDVYALVKGKKNGTDLLYNSLFGTNTDPIELSDITRRPAMLQDLYNTKKTDNLAGIIYDVDGIDVDYVRKNVDMARRIDYWVAKAGNESRGLMPENEYRANAKSKSYGINLNYELISPDTFIDIKHATASSKGQAPSIIIHEPIHIPPQNIALGKRVYASSAYSTAYTAENINDDNLNTIWGASPSDTQPYVYIDLGKQNHINDLIIEWADKYFANKYIIGISQDAKNWTTAEMTGDGGSDYYDLKPYSITARYVGIMCLSGPTGYYGIKEFKIMQ